MEQLPEELPKYEIKSEIDFIIESFIEQGKISREELQQRIAKAKEDSPIKQLVDDNEALMQENILLKGRVSNLQTTTDLNNQMQQDLFELLIEMGLI